VSNGTGSQELDGLSQRAFEIARKRQAAATEIEALFEDRYESLFASHAPTLLRAAAWLAGTSLFRSLGLPTDNMEPGSPVLSDASNEQGLKMLKVFMVLLEKDGFGLKPDDYSLELTEVQLPRLGILQVQEQLQDAYNAIMQKHGFDYADGARTGAIACARLVRFHCLDRHDLEPQVAASTVSMGFVEGSKTAPAPLKG